MTLDAVPSPTVVNMSSLPKAVDWMMVSLLSDSLSMACRVFVLPLQYSLTLIVCVFFLVLLTGLYVGASSLTHYVGVCKRRKVARFRACVWQYSLLYWNRPQKKGATHTPSHAGEKEETMSKQTENNINLTLTLITIVSAFLMWRQDYGHVVMAITSITFLLSSAALLAHFLNGLDA